MRKGLALAIVWLGTAAGIDARAQVAARESPSDVLSADEWKQVDGAVERALAWLAHEQQPDGSFPTLDTGQPGVTSLCIMAFISHGHVPGDGKYGQTLERAIDFVLSCQKSNGLVTLLGPVGPLADRNVPEREVGICAAYNHAISSLVLSEAYGMSRGARAERIERAVERSLRASLLMQRWPKDRADDHGGWRYIDDVDDIDSDLSVTGWELMFLRSARNAGFDVGEKPIADAIGYVRRCYAPELGTFEYAQGPADDQSRCMAGAGILALAHAGYHKSTEAQQSGKWLLAHDFTHYNVIIPFGQQWVHDRYHYGLFNSCQGMYQLGGEYWKDFFPPTVATLLENQQPDGSWPSDSHWHDGQFGNAYTTALVVMTLGAPNQLLPVFQR
ncbi:MAG: prenyltransferase/squalene oxidase repeat-containing protein [Pirellulales bacterium]